MAVTDGKEPVIEEAPSPVIEGTEKLTDIRDQFRDTVADPPKEEVPVVIQPEPQDDPAAVAKWERSIIYTFLRQVEWGVAGIHAVGYNLINSGESKVDLEKIRQDATYVESIIDKMPISVKKWIINNIPWWASTMIEIEKNYITKIAETSYAVKQLKEESKTE